MKMCKTVGTWISQLFVNDPNVFTNNNKTVYSDQLGYFSKRLRSIYLPEDETFLHVLYNLSTRKKLYYK